MPIDHAEALRQNAAERYLLGELQGGVREEYEEHFFTCAECAADIRAGVTFGRAAREILQGEAAISTPSRQAVLARPRWFSWLRPAIAAPAFVVLIALVAYENFWTIPQMSHSLTEATRPQALKSLSLIAANSRGSNSSRIRVAVGQTFLLFVDVPPEPHHSEYLFEIESEFGATRFSILISAEEARNTVPILVPGSRLETGKYALVVRGVDSGQPGSGSVVASYPFALEIVP